MGGKVKEEKKMAPVESGIEVERARKNVPLKREMTAATPRQMTTSPLRHHAITRSLVSNSNQIIETNNRIK